MPHRTSIVCVLSGVFAFAACGGGPAGPSALHPALTERTDTAHFLIRTSPGDPVDANFQEQYYEWLVEALQVTPSQRLEYHKYRNREHLEALTGKVTNGFAETGSPRFHTIWPIDNHECVHTIVMLTIGHPPPLFNEGVAVAHQARPDRGRFTPAWNGTDLHELARGYDATGRLPALSSLLRGSDFFEHDTNITYPASGSFVRYVIDTYGLAAFKAYARSARFEDAAGSTETHFRAAYGRELSGAWEEWRAWLRR